MRFALNHAVAPRLPFAAFLDLCRRLGVTEAEIRAQPSGPGAPPPAAEVRRMAADAGVTLLAVNALSPFNLWSGDLPGRAEALADYAAEAGARALVLCPLNDGRAVEHSATVAALDAMRPLLDARGLAGLVEPLGFVTSSLRRKADALTAMTEADDGGATYRLLHDTFHHHLSGETAIFPNRTGLVHVSGVSDAGLAPAQMRDADRGLVDAGDRLGTAAQVRALLAGGYDGPFSFEPFADAVHALDDAAPALRASMAHLEGQV